MSEELLIVAGEISGDLHAADVVRAAKARMPDLRFWGIGGERMRTEGVETVEDAERMAVMGLAEILRHYRFIKGVFRRILKEVDRRGTRRALLVDYPGFNLRLAAELKKRDVEVFYYISPKVWAWNARRIPRMARSIDRLFAIFPFEPAVFANSGLRTEFVGHPLVGQIDDFLAMPEAPLPWDSDRRVALLPGSRRQEIERILPAMLAAAERLEERFSDLSFLIATPSRRIDRLVRETLEGASERPERLAIVCGAAREAMRQARAAIVASGTATLETALVGTPHVLTYRTSAFTYELGRRLVRVPFIGLVNVVLNRAATPELIQHDATPERLAKAVGEILEDTPKRAGMLEDFRVLRETLGDGRPAERVALALGE